jgi:CubicO group peptidase (beta-lactamase class C family)
VLPLPRDANSGSREAMGRNTRSRSLAVYGFLMALYSREFLARHGAEMLQNFEDLERASPSKTALWRLVGEDFVRSLISRDIPKSIWGNAAPLFIVLLVAIVVFRPFAYDLAPMRDPEALGLSSPRLARIAAWQQVQVNAGAFSGAVAAVARNGKVAYLRAVGFRDDAKTIPLRPDAIFWIASMTKPVTSAAAMMLVEEGRLNLAAPVHQYIPELKNMMVGVETRDPANGEVKLALKAQERSMTVEDLLRDTSGLVYGDRGNTAVHKLYRERGLYDKGLARDATLQDFVSRVARMPLAHQPGEVWENGHSADVLGRVIEFASGQSLDQFLDNRLFKPLGMVDTGFWVPPEKLDRLVDPPVRAQILPDRDVSKPTTLFSGGGGLVSTAADYLRFCQMLLNGGDLDGVRVLSPATVRRMTTNALPPEIRFANGSTIGFGFGIRSDAAWSTVPGSVGSFFWSGVWGTYFWVDPAEQLVAVQLLQIAPGKSDPINSTFRHLTYGAFLVPDRGIPVTEPAAIDQEALAAFEGTYRFASSSSRDKQERREFGGLGVEIAMQDGLLKVLFPIRDAPADRAGVMANDIITHLNDQPTRGMTLNQALEKMRGPINTTVRLKLERKSQDRPIELTITRTVIRPEVAGPDLRVTVRNGKLLIQGKGALPVLDFEVGAPIAAVPISSNEFVVDGGDHTRMAFLQKEAGEATGLVLNPGPWQITGQRIN